MTAPPSSPTDVTTDRRYSAADELLRSYRPATDRFFASPSGTLLARGVRAAVRHGPEPLPVRVRSALQAARTDRTPVPVAIGAVPFHVTEPCAVAVPRVMYRAPALAADPAFASVVPPSSAWRGRLRPLPGPEGYASAVEAVLELLRSGELSKVVLARALDVTSDRDLDLPGLLRRLAVSDPAAHVFAVPSGGGRTLLGASPELLVARRGRTVTTVLLAGSRPRGADPRQDAQYAAELRTSDKDRREHTILVDAALEALHPHCTHLDRPPVPRLSATATMWHLATAVTGTLADEHITALALACALHPTPAVCGTPTPAAQRAIRELERFDRGMYTGLVGWEDLHGDGEWALAIRCAEATSRTARLFAGAGIVAGSCPQAETAETGAKFATVLRALGVQP
ncbi:isochorismate synthase [Streptomyces luteolus]|uniref:isochorismate synthase n=1 Tax=Streptomyces luteolus TaxID=3043615 RepID=A0ABT6SPT2_9ACTN|nr:isochorismate synthase [Streptomyces sp. B-S-A12]MDI3417618.1 isochorismate synthase [Streptomyces sp. B-S-A12]